MDVLNRRLLAMLRRDGRRSVLEMAKELGVARATVAARIERMEQSGDIVGYTVVLRADRGAMPVRGIMLLHIEGRVSDRLVDVLAGYPEIAAVHTTTGKWDIVIEIGAESLSDFDAVQRRIKVIPGVMASETHLLLATPITGQARL